MDREKAEDLMNAANDIIGTLDPAVIDGAINWADLMCTTVEYVERYCGGGATETPETTWRVVLEEASPGAFKLAAVVHDALYAQGYRNVEVATAW